MTWWQEGIFQNYCRSADSLAEQEAAWSLSAEGESQCVLTCFLCFLLVCVCTHACAKALQCINKLAAYIPHLAHQIYETYLVYMSHCLLVATFLTFERLLSLAHPCFQFFYLTCIIYIVLNSFQGHARLALFFQSHILICIMGMAIALTCFKSLNGRSMSMPEWEIS